MEPDTALCPRVRDYLADRRHAVEAGGPLWETALPLHPSGQTADSRTPRLCYGAYFEAAHRFLAHDDWRDLRCRFADDGAALSDVEIFLEKHGACYHPARVVARAGARHRSLVLNVAVSAEGRRLASREVEWLQRIETRFEMGRLPAVYAFRTVTLDDGRELPMFLGEWFEGFYEFHLSADSAGETALVAWAPEGPLVLSASQRRDLYRQAALILTGGYDPASGERIADWQHAAGDFVLKPVGDDRVDLRLVTVRDYRPLLDHTACDPSAWLPALALFLVDMSMELRRDRLDGVGEFVLSGVDVVGGAVEGFFQALDRKVARQEVPAPLAGAVAVHLGEYTTGDLLSLVAALAGRRAPDDPLSGLTGPRAADHARHLRAAIRAAAERCIAHYIQR